MCSRSFDKRKLFFLNVENASVHQIYNSVDQCFTLHPTVLLFAKWQLNILYNIVVCLKSCARLSAVFYREGKSFTLPPSRSLSLSLPCPLPLLDGQKLFEELSQSGRRVGLNVCSTENLKLQRWARELRTCGVAAVYLLLQMMDGRTAGCSVLPGSSRFLAHLAPLLVLLLSRR